MRQLVKTFFHVVRTGAWDGVGVVVVVCLRMFVVLLWCACIVLLGLFRWCIKALVVVAVVCVIARLLVSLFPSLLYLLMLLL